MFTPYINKDSSNFSYIELFFKKHIESDLPILKDYIPFKRKAVKWHVNHLKGFVGTSLISPVFAQI